VRHSIEILRSAQKQLAKIDQQQRPRLYQAIRKLADDPRPPGTKKLSGRAGWRIRVGSYRIIYEIHDDRLLVLVVAIGDRKEIYR